MTATPMPATWQRGAAGKIGLTLLCLYLLGVAVRIEGCYAPEPSPRDEVPGAGPRVGARFPAFALRDVSGVPIALGDLAGTPSVLTLVPSLDWSPPSKARLLEIGAVLGERRDVRIAVVLPEAQATARGLRFVRDHQLPFYFLVDTAGLIEALGLATRAPDGSVTTLPATFVLDATGVVRLRDVRRSARVWVDPGALVAALATAAPAAGTVSPRASAAAGAAPSRSPASPPPG